MLFENLRINKNGMLKEQLQKDLTSALKSGDQLKRLTLGTVLSAVKNKELQKRNRLSSQISDISELEKQSRLNEEEVMEVIASEVKRRRDAVEQFKAASRHDLAEKEEKEIGILSFYLPKPMSEEEIREIIKNVIGELKVSGVSEMGKVIGAVRAQVKGRAEGGLISRLVKEALLE